MEPIWISAGRFFRFLPDHKKMTWSWGLCACTWMYALLICYIASNSGHRKFVSFPMKHGDFPY